MRKWVKYAPCLLAGPVTGPCLALMIHNAGLGRFWRAAFWTLPIAFLWIGLPAIMVLMGHYTIIIQKFLTLTISINLVESPLFRLFVIIANHHLLR